MLMPRDSRGGKKHIGNQVGWNLPILAGNDNVTDARDAPESTGMLRHAAFCTAGIDIYPLRSVV